MTEFNYDLPTVKFTYKSNKENIMLADLSVYLGTNLLQTYIKPTDKHQYLRYTSAHRTFTKCSIIYSQELIMSRICCHNTGFEKHLVDMTS